MRSYTPISSDDDRGHFDLLIKVRVTFIWQQCLIMISSPLELREGQYIPHVWSLEDW